MRNSNWLEQHAKILIPLIALLGTFIGFLIGIAYQAGCAAQKIRETSEATSELYLDVKNIKSDIGHLKTDIAVISEKLCAVKENLDGLRQFIEKGGRHAKVSQVRESSQAETKVASTRNEEKVSR